MKILSLLKRLCLMSSKISSLSKQNLTPKLQVKDYLVSGENFHLFHDNQWDMLVTVPQPENLSKYYDSPEYKPHEHSSKGFFDKLYNFIRNRSYQYKLKIFKRFHPSAQSVLDYGTATGEFLHFLKQKTFKVSGVEPNKKARERANHLLDGEVKVSLDEIANKVDIISLWHVLEHIPDPDGLIEKLKEKLQPNGMIVIAVPNFKSYDAQYYRQYWAAYDVPRHLWHFSPLSLQKLFAQHGMKLVGQKPLYFDSFYVSLLSEQYKTGKKRLFPAFVTGLKSNWKARKTGQYSSLVYIFK